MACMRLEICRGTFRDACPVAICVHAVAPGEHANFCALRDELFHESLAHKTSGASHSYHFLLLRFAGSAVDPGHAGTGDAHASRSSRREALASVLRPAGEAC